MQRFFIVCAALIIIAAAVLRVVPRYVFMPCTA